jgi:hypothetical protein
VADNFQWFSEMGLFGCATDLRTATANSTTVGGSATLPLFFQDKKNKKWQGYFSEKHSFILTLP